MWKIVVLLALVKSGFCGIFDFTEFDNPYYNNEFFFNRPGAIIRQHHGRCTTTINGGNQEGVCLSRPECTLSGGRPQGRQSCLLGTCCVYSRGCNQVTTKRVSYFEGTTTTAINNNECTYTVRAENDNICQMRLDFDSFTFPNPTRNSVPNAGGIGGVTLTGEYICRDGLLTVSAPNGVHTLCGNNNGQHVYIHVNASRGERDLVLKVINNFISNTNNLQSLSWKIKITQLECPTLSKHQKSLRVWEDSLLVAPAGCLQYHLNPTGTIRNLGFGATGIGAVATNANEHYAANLNYAICFRRTPDMCGMDFNVNQFRLSGDMGTACTTTLTTPGLNPTTVTLDADYLWIPNGRYTTTLTPTTPTYQDRYCGIINVGSSIRSVTPGPFYIFFRTDNQVLQDPNDPNPGTPPNYDPENGWELTYSTLYGTTCGTSGI